MGNSLPLACVCYDANCVDEATTAAAGAERSRNKQRKTASSWNGGRAAARHVVPVDMPGEELDDGGKEGTKQLAAWPAGCRVDDGDGGVVRVKVVMKRKEVEELVARLEQRDDAAERKARMEELNTELGSGGGGSAVAVTSPCRDAWRPRLASIPEN